MIKHLILEAALKEPGTAFEIAHRVNRTIGGVAAHLTLLYQAGKLDRTKRPSTVRRNCDAWTFHAFGVVPEPRTAAQTAEQARAARAAIAAQPLPPPNLDHPRWRKKRIADRLVKKERARRIVTTYCRVHS